MKSLVASVAKMPFRVLVLGLSTRPVAGSKNWGFSAWLSAVSSSTAVCRVSMAAESKHVLTSRDPSRVRPGWAANTALASGWTRMVGGTAVSRDLR